MTRRRRVAFVVLLIAVACCAASCSPPRRTRHHTPPGATPGPWPPVGMGAGGRVLLPARLPPRAFRPTTSSRVVGRVFLPPTIEQRVLFGASAFTTD
jgi:hypothetical protein